MSLRLVLPARTRLYLSLGICLVGATGLMVSDYLENTAIPVVKEKEKLAQAKINANSTTSTSEFSPEPEAASKNY